jgi:hypothetical protein
MAQAVGWIKGAQRRIQLWKRDIDIAQHLTANKKSTEGVGHGKTGWQHLAQLHDLTRSGVYYAAARGRKYLQLQKKDH